MWEVVVDKDKCNGDEECVDACPSEVFEMVWMSALGVKPALRCVPKEQ
jgi:NAD-dependent dihydropyrimidine dehydrogenase PreA subunit